MAETLIYHHGEYPYKYKEGMIELALNVVYTKLGHELSPTADITYTYGNYIQPTSNGEVTGHYLKVWKIIAGEWKLVAHNLAPNN